MSRRLAFTPRARRDVESVYRRYESQRAGLGSEFEEELAHTLSLLRSMPEAGPVVHRTLRRLLVRRFPYSVYYRLTDATIDVRGCLHQHRDPRHSARRA